MYDPDVPDHVLSDRDIEVLVAGGVPEHGPPALHELVAELQSAHLRTPPLSSAPVLAELVDIGRPEVDKTATAPPPRRRTTMNKIVAGASAAVATTAGKLFLTGAVAAATLSGAHAAEVIEVPGLGTHAGDQPTSTVEATENGGSTPIISDAHGRVVSTTATTSELDGCERGQAIASQASSKNEARDQNARPTGEGRTDPAGGRCEQAGPPDGAGAPQNPGPPVDPGQPDGSGPPQDPGQPGGSGPSTDPGQPNGAGAPQAPGPPADPGPLDGSGPPPNPGQPGGARQSDARPPADPSQPEPPGRADDPSGGRG